VNDVFDEDKCRACGGKCCRLYSISMVPLNEWFEDWCQGWDQDFQACGAAAFMPPQFDPLEVHLKGNEHMLGELAQRGIDPYGCQYLGKDGCLLPRGFRPVRCREFMCNTIPKEPLVPAAEVATIGAMVGATLATTTT
jgi:hypothetical protein